MKLSSSYKYGIENVLLTRCGNGRFSLQHLEDMPLALGQIVWFSWNSYFTHSEAFCTLTTLTAVHWTKRDGFVATAVSQSHSCRLLPATTGETTRAVSLKRLWQQHSSCCDVFSQREILGDAGIIYAFKLINNNFSKFCEHFMNIEMLLWRMANAVSAVLPVIFINQAVAPLHPRLVRVRVFDITYSTLSCSLI